MLCHGVPIKVPCVITHHVIQHWELCYVVGSYVIPPLGAVPWHNSWMALPSRFCTRIIWSQFALKCFGLSPSRFVETLVWQSYVLYGFMKLGHWQIEPTKEYNRFPCGITCSILGTTELTNWDDVAWEVFTKKNTATSESNFSAQMWPYKYVQQ